MTELNAKPGVEKITFEEEQALVTAAKDFYDKSSSNDSENRRLFTEDMRFAFDAENNGQWDPNVLAQRFGRPSYTFNRCIGTINLVLGDQRQTKPAIKVRAATKQSAVATAEIFGGMIRDIEQCSGAEAIYDEQFKYAVAGGFGVLRVLPEFASDDSFDQVLRIKGTGNPLTAFFDPESQDPCRGDAMKGMVADLISKDKYKELYPGLEPQNFEISRDTRGWVTENEVRVAEFFQKKAYQKEIALLKDGTVVDWDAERKAVMKHIDATISDDIESKPKVLQTRKVTTWKVEWIKVDGAQVLEGPIVYNWKRIPLIRIPGRFVNIEGKQKVQSLIRHGKDPQRVYNYHRSTMVEAAALTPRAPYIVTGKMVKGYEQMWATANTNPRPYLAFDVDPAAPTARPTREAPPDVPEALVTLAQQDISDLQAATGYFDASLGNSEDMDRTSGKALVAHQRRSDLGSYEFIDNFGKALKLLAECCVDMIPTVYDTQRIVRTLGVDGVEKYVEVNKGDIKDPADVAHNLAEGSFDVTVTIGPSYQTARQETLATLIEAAERNPLIAAVSPDIIAKNMDTQDSDELVKRIRRQMIQQGLIDPTPEEQKNAPPPKQPDPMQVAELAKAQAIARRDTATAQISESKAQTGDIQWRKLIAEVVGQELTNILAAQEAAMGGSAALTMEQQLARVSQPGVPSVPGAPVLPNQ